jgi:O-antigen/teichoic acid export membrane protein
MKSVKSILTIKKIGEKFSNGVFWAIIGTVVSQGGGLIVSIFAAQILGKTQFGEYGIILSTISMYGVLAGLWLGIGATKFVAELKDTAPKQAGNIIALSYLIAIISSLTVSMAIITFAPFIAKHVLNAPHLSTELRIVAGVILLNALDGVQVGALAGFEAFKKIAKTLIVRGVISIPVTIIMIWKWGLNGAILSLIIIGIINFWINRRALNAECKKNGVIISLKGARQEIPTFMNFSTPALLGGLMGAPVLWLAHSILVAQPNGYNEMALYTIANQWKTVVIFLPKKMISVALPMMSAETAANSDSRYKFVFELTHGLSILIAIPLVTFLQFSSNSIAFLYGADFAEAKYVLTGAFLAAGISAFGSGVGPAVQANGKMWFGLFTNAIWSVIFLLFVWLLAPELGAKALVYGMALAYLVSLLYSIFYMRKNLPIGILFNITKGIVFLVFICLLAVKLNNSVLSLIGLPIAVLSFIFVFKFLISPVVNNQVRSFYANTKGKWL